jgi:lipopolysaccharide biosynthesis regulator YciM
MAFETKEKILKQKKGKDKKILALYKIFEGENWFKKEEYHKARLCYKEALNNDELCIPAYFYLGEAYLAEDRLDDAVEFWKKLLEKVPQASYLVFDKLEKALFELGQYEEIVEIYENSLLQNPKNTQILFAFANIYEKKGRNREAEEKYRQILEIDPSFIPAKLRLVKIYEQEKRGEKLKTAINELLETFPPRQESFSCSNCEYVSTRPLWKCPNCHSLDSFNIIPS